MAAPIIILEPETALDVVAPRMLVDSLAIALNNGDGTFGGITTFPTGDSPESVATGDFNGDGVTDLATANEFGNSISILLGDGTGGYAAPVNYAAGNPHRLAVADINGDGQLDLVTAAAGIASQVQVLFGLGGGTFAPAVTAFPTPAGAIDVEVVDLNGDGRLDIVASSTDTLTGSVSVGLGQPGGGFAVTTFPAGTGAAEALAIGDLNGDGLLDVVAANLLSDSYAVLLGLAGGGFGAPQTGPIGAGLPTDVAVADINGDGRLDMAVACAGPVRLFLGNGDGTFAPGTSVPFSGFLHSVAFVDLNGDGKLDLATGSYDSVRFSFGDGTGSFGLPTTIAIPNLWEGPITLAQLSPLTPDLSANVSFTEGAAQAVAPELKLADPGGGTLVGATVAITDGFAGSGDVLAASTAGTSITASFVNGVLRLTGTDTLAHYEQVLHSVTFSSGTNPDNAGRNPHRHLALSVDDGTLGGTSTAIVTLHIKALGDFIGTPRNDVLRGTSEANIMKGLAGNDVIRGNAGDDVLIGGRGVDLLHGGAGDDVFVFPTFRDSAPFQPGQIIPGLYTLSAGFGKRDVIADFTRGHDTIDLSGIDANNRVDGNQHFTWRGKGDFTHRPGQLIERLFNLPGTSSDRAILYGDMDGDARADFQIELRGLKNLTASDFFL